MQVAERNLSQTIVEAENIMLDMPQAGLATMSRIWRSHDPQEINKLINNPDINETGNLDATSTIDGNVWLLGDGFSSFFINRGKGVYEVHIGVAPLQRGKVAFDQAREAMAFMFTKTDCREIIGIIPAENRAAVKFGRLLGFKSRGVTKHQYISGDKMSCEVLFLEKGPYPCHKH